MGQFLVEAFSDPIIMSIISLQLVWTIFAIIQLAKLRSTSHRRKINYYLFESIPSTFVTIGLFGTCLGIAIGLYKFDVNPENIKGSVQVLLRGLKSAFFVTILGLFLSLLFKNIINHFLNRYADIQPPESPELEQLKAMNENLRLLGASISDSFKRKFDDFLDEMKVINRELITKLNSFASTLADQNQQALIEALQGVVQELNSGFKDILGSLVRQNFQTLTDSVNSLNNWQKQHKVQVELLIEAYTEIVGNTEKLDATLTQIVKKNELLVGQNGKLIQIIDSLNEVLVEDSKYIEIVNQLKLVSQNISEASSQYKDNLKEINHWFSQEHSIKESIILLNEQLSQIEDAPTFNNRLSNTFGTLDKILNEYHKAIPKIVEKSINGKLREHE